MRWCSGATSPTGGNDEHDDCGDDRAGPRLMYSRAHVRLVEASLHDLAAK